MLLYLIYMVLGIFAGTLSGLFGIGGGIIIVPTLIFCFKLMSLPNELVMHMALGTSLATIFVTALSSVYSHHKKNNVDWALVFRICFGVIIGTAFGAYLADGLSAKALSIIFAIYISLISLKMWIGFNVNGDKKKISNLLNFGVGLIIGFKSALLGIGGGTISIPFLTWSGRSMRQAVGASAALGIPIAFVGSLSYALNGLDNEVLPPHSFGYIYLPAFVGIILTSSFFARLGAALSHRLPQEKMRKGFAFFLMIVAIKTIFSF